MKSEYLDLVDDVVSAYDQTKTTIQGRVSSKTINSQTVLGPPLTEFLDVFTDSGVTPSGVIRISPNVTANVARVFVLGAETAGLTPLLLYNFNLVTGANNYVGRIDFRTADTAATTTTFRMLKVDDVGTTGWKIYVATTGSVLINGGPYLLNNIDLADFVPIGFPSIPFATGNNQKAVYFLQDPANIGAGRLNTATAGGALDKANNRLYIHNGIAATHQYYVFDTSVSPTYTTAAVTGVAATDIISDTGHTFVNNDPVVFTTLTGGAGLTVGTTYFVVGSVAGVSYQLSATSGGAAINFTTDISAATIGRAFGTSSALFLHKTGNLPALTGTLLLNNAENKITPAHGTNSGQNCISFATSTNLYVGQTADLTSGAVSWPTLATSNILGAVNETTAPTAAGSGFDGTMDRFYYITNTASFYYKQLVNNMIDLKAGFLNTEYYEGLTPTVFSFGTVAIVGSDAEHGFQAFSGSTVGQRGVFLHDIRSNSYFDYSYIVTKVFDFSQKTIQYISTLEQLFDYTASMVFYYRTSGFGSISGGWTQINIAEIPSISPASQIQFKIAFNPADDAGTNASQIHELAMVTESINELSDNWQVSKDLSSTGATHKVVYYLAKAYASSVPTLYTRAYQQGTTTSVGSNNTSANPGQYRYSTNGGSSWNNLGTIPNTVGTLVEWTINPSPTVDYLPSIRES